MRDTSEVCSRYVIEHDVHDVMMSFSVPSMCSLLSSPADIGLT